MFVSVSKSVLAASMALLMLICSNPTCDAKIKVACVGNSITYGANIANREQNSYPAQLQAYLGQDYEVVNFGVNGHTLLNKGDLPYTASVQYPKSLEFNPDIVLIKLGTNDSKPQNRRYFSDFAADYKALIDSYRNLDSKPEIILLTPIRCFLPEGSEIDSAFIADRIVPAVKQTAYDNDLELINLQYIFGDRWQSHILPDMLHPSAIGAGIMAQKIGDYLIDRIKNTRCATDFPGDRSRGFSFHGFQGYDFTLDDGVECRIVMPRHEAEGKPWVMRARFWGHEPQTDIALLEHGFHIAYCDVADLYGSPKAVDRWNRFHSLLVNQGFSPKATLEGMSRGGLIVYNWAMANPDKVACIYADAPVMSLSSWPLGSGGGSGSPDDAGRMMSAYGFTDASQAESYSTRHITDIARAIASAGIPVLHVVGDADTVVPYNENTLLLEQAMESLGRPIKVIHKPDVGHHPHSLKNPEPIVNFILSATIGKPNHCTHPVPGNEFRQGAGWTEGSEWHSVAEDIMSSIGNRPLKLLLLGNSITQGWGGDRKRVAYKPGKQWMDSRLGTGNWQSAGISGDKTQNLLWRLQGHDYARFRPENVVIAIGVNNLIAGDTADDTAEGIIAVTEAAEKLFPESKIILLGLYPAGRDSSDPIRRKCDSIHNALSAHNFARAIYHNPSGWFVSDDGTIPDSLYSGDYIHFSPEGYRVATDNICRLLD